MNTDMLIFRYVSIVVRKMTAYWLCCAGLIRLPFVFTEHISSIYIIITTPLRCSVEINVFELGWYFIVLDRVGSR